MLARTHLRETPLDAAHRAKLWAGVMALRGRRRALRRSAVALGGLAVVSAAVLVVVLGLRESSRTEAANVTQRDTSSLVLADGSELLPAAGSRLELRQNHPEDVRIVLSVGSVDFSVSHRPGRRFIVILPAVALEVVGTRFSATVEETEQRVRVHEGAVEVRESKSGELLGRIAAGGSWSGRIGAPQVPSLPDKAADPPAATVASAKPSAMRPREVGASEAAARLFDEASRARRQGKFAEAIAGYEKLVARYPDDRHAALAAFELGRLKRQRHDPAGAARALEQALETRDGTPVGEDALAQLVLSYDEAGNLAGCRTAQKRYLATYPQGVHRTEIRRRCRSDERK